MNSYVMIGTTVLVAALLQVWLHLREISYQRRHYFTDDLKTCEYKIAKLKITMAAIGIETLFLIAILKTGLNTLYDLWLLTEMSVPLIQWAVFITAVMFAAAVQRINRLIRIWVVEKWFGYARQTIGLFCKDTLTNAGLLFLCGGSLGMVCIHMLQQGWSTGWSASPLGQTTEGGRR